MLLAICFAVGALAACKISDNNCEKDQCDTVGGTEICMQCAATFVPIDGVCVTAADQDAKCTANSAQGICSQCKAGYFMYKGGCYLAGVAGPGIGTKMCKTAASGVCTVAADAKNYFVPPTNTNDAHDSVVWCGDETGITLGSTQYKGIAKCKVCDAPSGAGAATCTTCEDGFFGAACADSCDPSCKTCEATGQDKCKSCNEGYFLGAANSAAGKCIQCNNLEDPSWEGVQNCAKCTSSGQSGTAASCTECAANFYLKSEGNAPTCVTADKCGEGFFATTVDSIKKCVPCGDATNGVEGCEKCTAPSEPTNKPTCTKCTDKYLKTAADGTTTCVDQDKCVTNSFPVTNARTGNKCVSCGDTDAGVPNCAKCNPPTGNAKPICITCEDGYTLDS